MVTYPKTTLRLAQQNDWPRLHLLYGRWQAETKEAWGRGLNPETDHVVVAVDRQGHIIGFGAISTISIGEQRFTEGHYVYVMPHYRQYQVGYRIYRYLRKMTKRIGFPVLVTATGKDYQKWNKRGYSELCRIMMREP